LGINDIAACIAGLRPVSGDADAAYLESHRRRYEYLMRLILPLAVAGGAPPRILDIGPSYQTGLMQQLLPQSGLFTLGFHDPRFLAVGIDSHIHYDLNLSADPATWPTAGPFDIVVMAEVIEHLHVAPLFVLRFVRSLVPPGGHLIIQTPNAVALIKRIRMLAGLNPFEPIREESNNPGHFCEYTRRDLHRIAERAGWHVESSSLVNYFGRKYPLRTLYDFACNLLPGEFGDGITLVLR
jgi:SAM-dependent methyltransferase